MPAGFLVTRLLLVCLLSEVEHSSRFATAQPPASQGVRNPYEYLSSLPLQHVQHERQLQDPHNPWVKIVEGFMKNRQHQGANHQLGWPDQIQNHYQHLPPVRVKYPSDVASHNPALDAKKIEFNVNVPVQHILKTLAYAKKGPEWFRDFREGEFFHRVNPVPYQEGAAGPFWSEHKGLPRDMAKRKRNPGLNFRFTAPVPAHRDRRPNLQRPDLAYLLSQSGLVQQSSPEIGLERPTMQHPGLGLHPCFGPAQMTPSGCPLVNQGQMNPSPPQQQQIQQPAQQQQMPQQQMPQQQMPQQQLPILSQILTAGQNSLSGGNLWTQEIAKQLPHFHLSIGNTPGDQQQKKAESKKPQSSGVYPRLRCSHPEARSTQGEQWMLCPRLYRGWIH